MEMKKQFNKEEYDRGAIDKRRRKFDLDKLIEDMFKEMSDVEKSDKTQGQKTQAFQRVAKKVINRLYGVRTRQKRGAIKLTTASKYLTKVRNEVTEKGWKHHSLSQSLERLEKKYPLCEMLIKPLIDQSLEATRLRVKALKDKLLQIDRLEKAVSSLDPNSTKYVSDVNNIASRFGDWKSEVDSLKPLNKKERPARIETLFSQLSQARELYNDLGKLKIDHEIMRWLVKDAFSTAEASETRNVALAGKKNQTIDVDYPTIMSHCEYLLNPPELNMWPWEALATGIALATGRRAIEVLVQGQFTKVGKYRLNFTGQAKERGGVDYENVFEIYSLVDADTVIKAVEMLRSYSNIHAMIEMLSEDRHYQYNELVHNRTATPLNKFMREFMLGANMTTHIDDRDWVFRDTRSIYAAICYKLFFETDKRWRNVDQDMFFQTLLGHSDAKSQAHYKQFKVLRAGEKWESISTETKDRLKELQAFDQNEEIISSDALTRIHQEVKRLIEQDPAIKISQKKIKETAGGNWQTIKKYMLLTEEALSFDVSLSAVLTKEPTVKVKEAAEAEPEQQEPQGQDNQQNEIKPRFDVPKRQEDGSWLVSFHLGDEHHEILVPEAANLREAGEIAWREFQDGQQPELPETIPEPVVKKSAPGWWHATIEYKGNMLVETMVKGKKEEAKQDAIRLYKERFQ